MVKSARTIRRELKAVQDALKEVEEGGIFARAELRAVRATLQWALGKHNVVYDSGPPKPPESRRPVMWVTDRSGEAVE